MSRAEPPKGPVLFERIRREPVRPILARLRRAGGDPSAFRGRVAFRIIFGGVLLLVVTILLPLVSPARAPLAVRIDYLAALVFLLAAPGLAMGMGRRAFVVAGVVVALLYAVTGFLVLPVQTDDLFVVALILSFAVFALAGFNLVFVLEEMVYDAHRLLPLAGRAWIGLPVLLVVALAAGLPFWQARGGPHLPALWVATVVSSFLLGAWWLVRAVGSWRGSRAILRELHLFVFGIILATALADGIKYLQSASEFVPSILAYLVLVGTWVYVTYTTLQRTHFLLQGKDVLTWVALLLAASFAIVAHTQELYHLERNVAVEDLIAQRVSYMVAGVWIAVAFYAGRALWFGLQMLRADRALPERTRKVAGKAARVARSVLVTERLVEGATYRLYRHMDRLLPGTQRPPQRRRDDEGGGKQGDASSSASVPETPKP